MQKLTRFDFSPVKKWFKYKMFRAMVTIRISCRAAKTRVAFQRWSRHLFTITVSVLCKECLWDSASSFCLSLVHLGIHFHVVVRPLTCCPSFRCRWQMSLRIKQNSYAIVNNTGYICLTWLRLRFSRRVRSHSNCSHRPYVRSLSWYKCKLITLTDAKYYFQECHYLMSTSCIPAYVMIE